jgi:Na+/proline symporter
MLKRLLSASIWGRGAIPPEEWKYRNLKRVALPILDALFIFGGLSAARYGVPAISEFFDDVAVDLFSYGLSVVAFGCLLGVCFPRLWWLEALAKSALLGLLTGYVVSLFLLTAVGEGNRGFVLIIAMCSMVFPIWRLTLLTAEWQDRRTQGRGSNG